MPWTPLASRLNQLPLILCGPLLRHTTYEEVTVWVALKEASTVTLTIFQEESNGQLTALFSGVRPAVHLGRHLYIVAVTAQAPPNQPLVAGRLYYYDLQFSGALQGGLRTSGIAATPAPTPGAGNVLSYSDAHLLPSFALPPDDLNQLRIVHGSCRKAHSAGLDTTEALDTVLAADWAYPDRRPHQVFFTGDQIYADEVPACLLAVLTEAGNVLLADVENGEPAWEEWLPVTGSAQTPGEPPPAEFVAPSALLPALRREVVLKKAAFTTREGQSHLLSLGEYFAMYLVAWSDVLWPPVLPTYEELFTTAQPDDDQRKAFPKDRAATEKLRQLMPRIRRALANIPSYMICDDHETTDDWYVTREWCEDVMKTPLGRRVMLNAMLTYAVCQAWGNTPEQFAAAAPGDVLLSAAATWVQSRLEDVTARNAVARRVGVPDTAAEVNAFVASVKQLPLGRVPRTPEMLDWHYTWRWYSHEVIALDVRTWRAFAGDPLDPPIQITDEGMQAQLTPDAPTVPLTLVLAPTNVLLVPLMHLGERWYIQTVWAFISFITSSFKRFKSEDGRARGFARTYDPDLADSWVSQTDGYEKLISWLATRNVAAGGSPRSHILILSGDVHFGWAGRMQYAAQRPYQATGGPVEAVIGHLTVSGLDNQVGLWNALHFWGFIPGDNFPQPRIWLGWADPATPGLSTIDLDRVASWDEDISFRPWMLERTPPMLRLKDVVPQQAIPEPDWLYRSDCVRGEKIHPLEGITTLAEGKLTIDNLADALRNHRIYADQGAAGMEIIGLNNFGDVSFHWQAETVLVADATPAASELRVAETTSFPPPPFAVWVGGELIEVREVDAVARIFRKLRRGVGDSPVTGHAAGSPVTLRRQAVQQTWWRPNEQVSLQPLTRFSVSLDFDDPEYPMPVLLPAPLDEPSGKLESFLQGQR